MSRPDMPTVCLLSPAHVWVNPRLRKEANALHDAGYSVRVAYRADGPLERDHAILADVPWTWHRLDVSRQRTPARWASGAITQRAAQALVRVGVSTPAVDAAAYCRGHAALVAWAIAQRAHLYIAHTQPVLAAAATAAQALGVPFAFDCEDLLSEETSDGGRARWRRDLIARLESRFLPHAAYVSATSRPMADYLAGRYSLDTVHVWHNGFPISERAGIVPPAQRPVAHALELAWISATIGRERGLEDAMAALRLLPAAVTLHVYGALGAGDRRWFAFAARGLEGRVIVHPLPPAAAVLRTLAHHHVGLSLDGLSPDCVNRSLTVCNKVFLYLQGGLACVATDTPGHASVLGNSFGASAGSLYPPGGVDALVGILQRLIDHAALVRAQEAAWRAGWTRYAWDVEREAFLRAARNAIGGRAMCSRTVARKPAQASAQQVA
jgi:Glycosyl transferase 4-like domain